VELAAGPDRSQLHQAGCSSEWLKISAAAQGTHASKANSAQRERKAGGREEAKSSHFLVGSYVENWQKQNGMAVFCLGLH
jgi:hypothetical protein